MAELQICMLGSFQVCWDFAPLSPSALKDPLAIRLLKLVLVRRPEPVTVADAAHLLGAGTAPAIAAAAEQVTRLLSPGAALLISGDELRFEPGTACWTDMDAMWSHYTAGVAAAARGEMFQAILAFQEADGLYQGDLLEELQEPWVQPARLRTQELYTDILERLAEGHAVLARYQDAVGFCHKALAHEPLRESTYQRMMVYYFYLGDMSGALDAYKACEEALGGAGRPVSGETQDLWLRLSGQTVSDKPDAEAASALQPPGVRRPG